MDKLLIVDDEEAMRRLLRINLADRYEIIDTGSPEEALAMTMKGKPFEEVSATENVCRSAFLCGCTVLLEEDSTIEVYLASGEAKVVGKARVIRSEGSDTPYPRYAFRFVKKEGDWILQ